MHQQNPLSAADRSGHVAWLESYYRERPSRLYRPGRRADLEGLPIEERDIGQLQFHRAPTPEGADAEGAGDPPACDLGDVAARAAHRLGHREPVEPLSVGGNVLAEPVGLDAVVVDGVRARLVLRHEILTLPRPRAVEPRPRACAGR